MRRTRAEVTARAAIESSPAGAPGINQDNNLHKLRFRALVLTQGAIGRPWGLVDVIGRLPAHRFFCARSLSPG